MDNEKKDISTDTSNDCSMSQTDAQGQTNLCCCFVINAEGEYDDPCFQPVDDCCCCG